MEISCYRLEYGLMHWSFQLDVTCCIHKARIHSVSHRNTSETHTNTWMCIAKCCLLSHIQIIFFVFVLFYSMKICWMSFFCIIFQLDVKICSFCCYRIMTWYGTRAKTIKHNYWLFSQCNRIFSENLCNFTESNCTPKDFQADIFSILKQKTSKRPSDLSNIFKY